MEFISEIYKLESLTELADYLRSINRQDTLREKLFSEFKRYANYSTPDEWNHAVRICECLAIIGWGNHTGVEAHAGNYVNGYPNTFFITPDNEVKYLDAVWIRRDGGIVIDTERSTLKSMAGREIKPVVCRKTKLNSQRNWLPKCPIRIVRTLDNCYNGSRPLIESIDNDLNPLLMKEMRHDLYGRQVNRIFINCAFSFYDNFFCKTNYIVTEDTSGLSDQALHEKLLSLFDESTIDRKGLFLRPRYAIGPFSRKTGKVNATIVFEKEFSEKTIVEQKIIFAEYVLTVVRRIASRLKNSDYNFRLMIEDLKRILDKWTNATPTY